MEEITKITDQVFPNGSPLVNLNVGDISTPVDKEEFLTSLNETITQSFNFFKENNVSDFVERLKDTNSPFYAIFENIEIQGFYLDQISNRQEIEQLTREKFNIPENKKCIISIKFE
jgi:hypothetical protein